MRALAGFLAGGFLTAFLGCAQVPESPEHNKPHNTSTETFAEFSYSPRYQTVDHRILDIERDFGVTEADYKELDSLIDNSKVKIDAAHRRLKDPSASTGSSTLDSAADMWRERINGVIENIDENTADLERLSKHKELTNMVRLTENWIASDRQKLVEYQDEAAAKLFFDCVKAALDERGYKSSEEDIVLLSEGLHKKMLDCDTYSMIDVGVAQALGLDRYPVRFVLTREHALVRWDRDGRHDPLNPEAQENKGDINCDPNNGDLELDDAYYIDGHFWFFTATANRSRLPRTLYLQSISPDRPEMLAAAYWNAGRAYRKINFPAPDPPPYPEYFSGEQRSSVEVKLAAWRKKYDQILGESKAKRDSVNQKAIDCFTKAIELSPKWDHPWGSRAEVLSSYGRHAESRSDMDIALYLMPFGN